MELDPKAIEEQLKGEWADGVEAFKKAYGDGSTPIPEAASAALKERFAATRRITSRLEALTHRRFRVGRPEEYFDK